MCRQLSTIVSGIIDDLLTKVCQSCVQTKQKHTGDRLSSETKRDWEKLFPWLVIVGDCDVKYAHRSKKECKLSTVWVEDGALSFQNLSVIRHNESSEHKSAGAKQEQSRHLNDLSESDDSFKVSLSKDEVLFNTDSEKKIVQFSVTSVKY